MFHARDLALLEKWTDVSPTAAISPTSPKATTFCCCPHRTRRYNLKSATKNQAKNIFTLNEFAYIADDGTREVPATANKSNNSNNKANNSCANATTDGNVVENIVSQLQMNESETKLMQRIGRNQRPAITCNSNNIIATDNTCASSATSSPIVVVAVGGDEAAEQWLRHDKSCSSNNSSNNCSCEQQTNNDHNNDNAAKRIHSSSNNNKSTVSQAAMVAAAAATTLEQQQQQQDCRCDCNENDEQHQQQQTQQIKQIQRLSNNNNNNNINNKENNLSNSNNNSNRQQQQHINDSNCLQLAAQGSCCCNNSLKNCHSCQRNNDDDNNSNNDSSNKRAEQLKKMTITTTTISSRKRSECGLTPTTTTTTTTPTSDIATTLASPTATTTTTTTPSVTTVIKTTMVKRSPNESTAAATTATHTQQQTYNSNNHNSNSNNNSNMCGESATASATSTMETLQEPTRSVKERIAAFAAGGNDQMRNHDNALRRNQCNSKNNTNNMTNTSTTKTATATSSSTSTPTSAINTHHINNNNNSSNNQQQSTAETGTGCNIATATSTIKNSSNIHRNSNSSNNTSNDDDILQLKTFALNEAQNYVDTASVAPPPSRMRSSMRAAGTATATVVGGSTGAATMPRRRSPSASSKVDDDERMKYGSISAALTADKKFLSGAHKPQNGAATATTTAATSLDNLDLALNLDLNDEDGEDPYYALQEYLERVKHEINEVFATKARQRMQQQQQQQQEQEQQQFEQQHAEPGDELTRSTESDSGFDSASGHSNKLRMHAATTVIGATAAATDEKVTEISAVNSRSDINGHALSVANSSSSSNKQLQLDIAAANVYSAAAVADDDDNDELTTPTITTTTKLQALPPPPLSPSAIIEHSNSFNNNSSNNNNNNSSTLQRLRKKLQAKAETAAAAAVAVAGNSSSAAAADEVNIWANKFLRDLDNLMGSDKATTTAASAASSVPSSSPMLLSAAATAAINSRGGAAAKAEQQQQQREQTSLVIRPEKHATIPLQSFNLDCGGFGGVESNARPNAANIAYLRTLSAPMPYQHQQQQQQQQQYNDNKAYMANGSCNRSLATFNGGEQHHPHHHHHPHHQSQHEILCNFQRTLTPEPTTILKIEEAAAAAAAAAANSSTTGGVGQTRYRVRPCSTDLADEELQRQRRQRQLENDMETIRNALLSQNQQVAAMEACNVNNGNNNNRNHSNNMRNTLVASTAATFIPKRERINQAGTASLSISPSSTLMTPSKTHGSSTLTTTMHTPTGYLLNGNDATKKGSTSTIWTSEESILRSVGAVDEDNNSTSSSACEEASGVLSSGKSGISLDSSGLDNDNNESGIGTATPPKDLPYWKSANHNHDNVSVSSLDALRKMKFQKGSSVASSDDPDLLEVLSLCDEPHGDEDVCVDVDEALDVDDMAQKKQRHNLHNHHQHQHRRQHDNDDSNDALGEQHDDEDDMDDDDDDVDEGHDEFETVTYCDCDCTDGDVSSASGSGSAGATSNSSRSGSGNGGVTSGGVGGLALHSDVMGSVVLRRKFNATAPPIMVPYGRAQKCRSHSLDTASLPTTYHHGHHNFHHYHQHHPSQLARKLHNHLHQPRSSSNSNSSNGSSSKERAQLSLALRQEPFQSLLSPTHFHELPSPSSASLHSGHESLGIQELTTKSNSAPLLLKLEKKRNDFAAQNLTLRYSRSQSDRYLAEIEAVEACKWLRAAGFPQYAQMYEDHQFPIDLTNVAKDHTNLEDDQLQSLYRRLCILNRCANMRLDQSHKAQTPQKEDSDDENFALSGNWTFQPHIRRWSRIGELGLEIPPAGKLNVEKTESSSKESSPDRFEDDAYDVTGAGLSLTLPCAAGGGGGAGSGGSSGGGLNDSTETNLNESADATAVRLRRSGSERFKDGAKALLRRVESIKSRRRKRQNREGIVLSGPHALDLSQLGQRSSMRKPDAVYSTPPSPSAVSPMHSYAKSPFFGNELKVPSQSENFLSPNRASPKRTPTTPRSMRTSPLHFFSNPMPHLREGKSDDSSSYFSDSQESSTGGKLSSSLRKTPSKTRRFLQTTRKVDDIGAHSDSECHQGRKLLIKDANSNTTEVKVKKLTRGGSLNLGKDPKKRDGSRASSFRSRSTTRKDVKTTDDGDIVKRTPVVRWHSFQMEERPHMIFRKCFSQKIDPNAIDLGVPFAAMSAGQLQIIRKLALVILTGYMERYCPTHRSGWNWELPKFIKKIKMPDYKDKKVFGVPLLLILQRTGQTLPVAVRSAFRWLQRNALDQTGLFRKSGVKSRIIKLKEQIEYLETPAECKEVYDAQQAYDVADMLKQYFRDLPESLLTTKMSETFAAIFQHLPSDVRLDAVQCAVLLLPDENREILYALLEFLTLVADNAAYNQMNANNLAVCLAPSLFHNSISTGSSSVTASPRRRGKGTGVPDAKELSEAKASHECLAFMIENYQKIYTATKEKINKCNFGYMEESRPVPLEALGDGNQFHNWRGYLYECTSATIKEGREKTRGWFTTNSLSDPGVEIAYKKVGDGHPLRLWRCITEVEGPPKDVLEYIIRQRASWDINLMQSQTVKKLDERTEIFQYAVDGQMTTDFVVLRSWQTDLPRGACVIVETSIEHAKAKPIYHSVRGVVLASRYLIEPCGSGRSRVMHLARVDIKGKTPEWYNKSYGHICSHYLSKIRYAFKNIADGPESKV